MRRIGLLQLGLICFVLASDLAEWPCFDDAGDRSSAPELSDGDECPPDLLHRQQALELAATVPALCYAAPYEHPAPILTRSSLVPDVCSRTYPGVALTYSHMSIQF